MRRNDCTEERSQSRLLSEGVLLSLAHSGQGGTAIAKISSVQRGRAADVSLHVGDGLGVLQDLGLAGSYPHLAGRLVPRGSTDMTECC